MSPRALRLASALVLVSTLALLRCSSEVASVPCQGSGQCPGDDICVNSVCVLNTGGAVDAGSTTDSGMATDAGGADASADLDGSQGFDGGVSDGGLRDGGSLDGGWVDGGWVDGGWVDGGWVDGGGDSPDGGTPCEAPDAGDAGFVTCSATDGGTAMDLAPPGDMARYCPVDGISCDTSEMLLFHIHSHLAIYVNGSAKWVPAGIGIGQPLLCQSGEVISGACFSWLHTHDESGIIHIESPVQRAFTLGDFFDVWGQPLSSTQVGPATGMVTAYLNGTPYPYDVRNLPLDEYNVIQLDVGQDVPPQAYTFPPGF